jgi:tetratricopeptide (TPR) repeat protein
MDDHVATPAWHLHPETRTAMRLHRVRRALDDGAWSDAVLEAEELLDERPDDDDAQFLLGEALLELGDYEIAQAVFADRVRAAPTEDKSLLGLAVASYHLCDFPLATESAREVARRRPDQAEAYFVLGLVLERDPARRAEATVALTTAARLDPDRFPLPMSLTPQRWQEAVELALDKVHPRIRAFWERVPVRIEACPDLADLRDVDPPLSPSVGALYAGRPPEDGDPYEHPPEAIRLFSNNLGRSPTFDAMVDDLAEAFEHEALDWLGLERDALEG